MAHSSHLTSFDPSLPVSLGGGHKPCRLPLSAFRSEPVQVAIDCADVAAAGRDSRSEAGHAGAGLVPYKTSPHETKNHLLSLSVGGQSVITFCKTQQAKNRVKRLKRNVWASGHLHGIAKKGYRPLQPWFVTLTYADANGWRPKHISQALDRFRRWCSRLGHACKYTWVSEIQPGRLARTGEAVVHYHAIVWLPVGVRMPFWDRCTASPSGRAQRAFWGHGMTNTEQAKSGVGYLMKYLSKLGELTVFPDGLRLYGMGGLDPLARSVRTWYNLPQWAKNTYGVGDLRRCGSSLVDLATGEVLPPMYSARLIPGGVLLTLLRDYPKQWQDGAYSTFPRSS